MDIAERMDEIAWSTDLCDGFASARFVARAASDAGKPRAGKPRVSDRMMSAFVAGAFVTALGALAVAPASAEEFTAAQKNIQAEHTAQVKAGKVEPCFGTALKGHNDGHAGRDELRGYQHRR